MLYSLLTDKNYYDSDLNESCQALKPPKNINLRTNNFSSDIDNTTKSIIQLPKNDVESTKL